VVTRLAAACSLHFTKSRVSGAHLASQLQDTKLFHYTPHDTRDNRLGNYLRLFNADQYLKRHWTEYPRRHNFYQQRKQSRITYIATMPDISLRESSLLGVGLRAMGRCPVAASGVTCRACLNAGADRHIVKRALPDRKPLPIRALNISVHPHYPLLSTGQQPLPFVRPADVMPPTATEAEFGLASDNNNLPIVTTKPLSAPVVLKNGTHQMPSRVSIGPLLQSPVSQPTTPIAGTMGPSPRPVKK
jgi:hypothetical protein